ncbi:glycosyltransferase family 4 protein [Viridibacillus sp. YIM B01967]|uniref:Glycosyltransferase family 4 protein n=2 Tax=Viridibacillus soli TaxID=2798301 RepID=A0ABS1HCF6_9BACL|nr:glycosyltransferase family 4 protein [Viridibacillus soli]
MLVDIIREMQQREINCEVVVLTKKNNFFGDKLAKLNVKIHYSSSEKIYSFKNIVFIKSIIKNKEYNIIHTHLFAPQLFTSIASKLCFRKIPLITTEHSTSNKRRDMKVLFLLDRWMYKQYDQIIAISTATKDNLSRYLPETYSKIIVIENGIDFKQYEEATPIDRNLIISDIQDNDKIILMVAAMREQKDPETLIRASELLPSHYHILFVGEGEYFASVKAYAKKYSEQNIHFLGSRSDVPNIMKSVDVFVLSSKYEGFGLVTVEAMASGLPVLASDIPGLREVVQEVGGEVFEAGNEKVLAQKIQRIISRGIYNKDYSKKIKKFTIEHTVAKYIQLYKENLK